MDFRNEKPTYLKSLKPMKSEWTGFLFVLNLILSLKSPELYLDIRFISVPNKGRDNSFIIKGCLLLTRNLTLWT